IVDGKHGPSVKMVPPGMKLAMSLRNLTAPAPVWNAVAPAGVPAMTLGAWSRRMPVLASTPRLWAVSTPAAVWLTEPVLDRGRMVLAAPAASGPLMTRSPVLQRVMSVVAVMPAAPAKHGPSGPMAVPATLPIASGVVTLSWNLTAPAVVLRDTNCGTTLA